MNILIELGILLIAFGSFVTYLGTKKDNDKGQIEINNRIDSFERHLIEVTKDNINPGIKQEKIAKIKNEFDSWATELRNNYLEIELAHEKLKLQRSEKKNVINKKWHSIFQRAFEDINNMVLSINQEMPEKRIEIFWQNRKFPINLFGDEMAQFYIVVKFNKEDFLKISVYVGEEISIPSLYFSLLRNLREAEDRLTLTQDSLRLSFNDAKQGFYIGTAGHFRDFFVANNDESTIKPFEELDLYLKKIITYQFILSSKKSTFPK